VWFEINEEAYHRLRGLREMKKLIAGSLDCVACMEMPYGIVANTVGSVAHFPKWHYAIVTSPDVFKCL
jgi:hypothetical protein